MECDLDDDQWESIDAELFAGRKIHAIKLFREFTGADLMNAKQFIDKYEHDLYANLPDQFEKAPGQGCLSWISVIVIGATVILNS